MHFPRTIAARLILVVTLSTSLILTAMLGFFYWRYVGMIVLEV